MLKWRQRVRKAYHQTFTVGTVFASRYIEPLREIKSLAIQRLLNQGQPRSRQIWSLRSYSALRSPAWIQHLELSKLILVHLPSGR